MKTINIMATSVRTDYSPNALDVSVDVEDKYISDILQQFDTQDLIDELDNREYDIIGRADNE